MRWLGTIILLFYAAVTYANPQLLGLRIQSSTDKTRFILIFSEPVTYNLYALKVPDRVVIELKGVSALIDLAPLTLNNPQVKLVRSIKHNQDLQLIFETTGTPQWESKLLPYIPSEGQKLQLDISIEKKKLLMNEEPTLVKNIIEANAQPFDTKELTVGQYHVVIDPGHGGKDPGAIGRDGTREKDVVLDIALKLAQRLNQQPHIHAVLTRDKDTFIPLRTRLDFARKNKADFFIAIHADAYFNNDAAGASVYALSQRGATSEAARWLAQKENHSELGEVEFKSLHDQSRLLRSVLIDLAQTATIDESLRLGNSVLDSMETLTTLHYRRVEQAPFVVLKSPDIPSILVETGFISNPKEAKRLTNQEYQTEIAEALLKGITRYLAASNNHKLKMTASYYGTADSEINTLIS